MIMMLFCSIEKIGKFILDYFSQSYCGFNFNVVFRYLGISLEGCVSLSWPSTENFASDNFEIKKWHQIFLGVFLILTVHVLGGME
jgi:hypothetical protein